MAKKFFTLDSLTTLIDEIKAYVANAVSGKANTSHTHSISNVTNLQSTLDSKADKSHSHAISDVTNLQTQLNGKAPTSHASTATTYGLGNNSNYGHVKLSDSTSTTSGVSNGVAATPTAVKSAYDLANTAKTNAATAQAKADSAYNLANGKADSLSDLGVTATAAELNYVDGVTSNIQTQLDSKQNTLTGGASTIASSNLTTNRALVSNGSGKVAVSAVTSTELGYLDGVTSNIQTQLNGKTTRRYCFVGSDEADTAGWYKVASQTMSGYGNTNITFMVISTYGKYYSGIFQLQMRSNSTSPITCYNASWLSRIGFSSDDIRIVVSDMTWTMYVYKQMSQHGRIMFEVISESAISVVGNTFTLYNSNVPESTKPVATVTSSDEATVNYANSSGSATSSTKATQDASGNTITSTYATKSELNTAKTNLQASIDGKAASSHKHTVSQISDLTATAKELNYVDGVTSSIQTQLDGKVPTSRTVNGKALTANITLSASDVGAAASSHTHASYVNQNAFSNVKVGSTTVAADTTTDTLTLVGSNITITPDATNDKVTIGITKDNVVAALGYTPPTTNTVYTHPTTAGNKHIPAGGSSGQILRWSADGTAVWGADNNTTYSVMTAATSASAGEAGLVPAPAAGKQSSYLRGDGVWATPTNTKNTAGATDSSSKLFLIGATTQTANPQTYSHNTAYVGTDGHLYSNSVQVVNLSGSQALTNKTYNGYTLGAACAKGVDTAPTSGSNNLITSGALYSAIDIDYSQIEFDTSALV